eukprot:COSAG01_NODE_412_length_17370_cov_26.910196_12_plen_113_part_00
MQCMGLSVWPQIVLEQEVPKLILKPLDIDHLCEGGDTFDPDHFELYQGHSREELWACAAKKLMDISATIPDSQIREALLMEPSDGAIDKTTLPPMPSRFGWKEIQLSDLKKE